MVTLSENSRSERNDRPTNEEIAAFQAATPDLIGVALRSLEVLAGEVSLPQFRLLLALRDTGRCQSSRVARALGVGASSVTRLADRLYASGHITRGRDERSRSVVTLELTERGRELVEKVLEWRHRELARILSRLPAEARAATAGGLRLFHEAVGEDYAAHSGAMPL